MEHQFFRQQNLKLYRNLVKDDSGKAEKHEAAAREGEDAMQAEKILNRGRKRKHRSG